jgi:hypothetical protein
MVNTEKLQKKLKNICLFNLQQLVLGSRDMKHRKMGIFVLQLGVGSNCRARATSTHLCIMVHGGRMTSVWTGNAFSLNSFPTAKH